MKYQYTAVNLKNKKSCGFINAESKADAILHLQNEGLTAVELLENTENQCEQKSIWETDVFEKDIHRIKINKKKLLTILNQMSIMMKAGVSLPIAMGVLIDGEKDKKVKQILTEMNKDLHTGMPLSESMDKFKVFSKITVNIINSGEANGRLEIAFERAAKILEKEIRLSTKIKGAMGYPVFLLILTMFLMAIMNSFVLPNFASIFSQFGAELPGITVFIMSISTFIVHKWYLILFFIFVIIFGYKIIKLKNRAFAEETDKLLLKIPAIGTLLKKSYTARFCRIMSSLIESGVEIVKSLEISRDVIPNKYYKNQLSKIITEVKMGASINSSMSKYEVFDSLLVSMIQVGEKSGMLNETLDKMASLYEIQTEEKTKHLTSILEPAMTIFIALIVGTVVISIIIPMFDMYSIISAG